MGRPWAASLEGGGRLSIWIFSLVRPRVSSRWLWCYVSVWLVVKLIDRTDLTKWRVVGCDFLGRGPVVIEDLRRGCFPNEGRV
jgi:hypothetical protein